MRDSPDIQTTHDEIDFPNKTDYIEKLSEMIIDFDVGDHDFDKLLEESSIKYLLDTDEKKNTFNSKFIELLNVEPNERETLLIELTEYLNSIDK